MAFVPMASSSATPNVAIAAGLAYRRAPSRSTSTSRSAEWWATVAMAATNPPGVGAAGRLLGQSRELEHRGSRRHRHHGGCVAIGSVPTDSHGSPQRRPTPAQPCEQPRIARRASMTASPNRPAYAERERWEAPMRTYSRLPAAGVSFFVSAWLLMIFASITYQDVGIRPFGYVTSMVVTIALWLVVSPAIGAIAMRRPWGAAPGDEARLAEPAQPWSRPGGYRASRLVFVIEIDDGGDGDHEVVAPVREGDHERRRAVLAGQPRTDARGQVGRGDGHVEGLGPAHLLRDLVGLAGDHDHAVARDGPRRRLHERRRWAASRRAATGRRSPDASVR